MQEYTFDPHLYLQQIVVVGLGGTGSQLAKQLASLLYHRREKRQTVPELVFIDPDIIEPHNIGRQAFIPAEIGEPKAAVLARRYNFAFGLEIQAICKPLNAAKHLNRNALVCGCVDNHHARKELASAQQITWIDAGNGFNFGQVVIGNRGDWTTVMDGLDRAQDGKCRFLPHAGLLFPELFQPEKPEKTDEAPLSCAELVIRDEQHLYVNAVMGQMVAQYVYQLLNREPITSFVSFATLSPNFAIRSIPITRENLATYSA
jgi:PRTRC genetic system ThiF family protein